MDAKREDRRAHLCLQFRNPGGLIGNQNYGILLRARVMLSNECSGNIQISAIQPGFIVGRQYNRDFLTKQDATNPLS